MLFCPERRFPVEHIEQTFEESQRPPRTEIPALIPKPEKK